MKGFQEKKARQDYRKKTVALILVKTHFAGNSAGKQGNVPLVPADLIIGPVLVAH